MRTEIVNQKKTIALLGGTGGTGRHVLLLALLGGHKVRALVRDPSKIPTENLSRDQKIRLTTIQGNAKNIDSVKELLGCSGFGNIIECCDVVISCIGSGQNRSDNVMTSTVENLRKAVDESQIEGNIERPKLIMMSSIGCGGTSPVSKFGLRALFGSKSIDDMDEADSLLRQDFPLKTTVCRPPRINETPLQFEADQGNTKKDTSKLKEYFATTDFPRLCPIARGVSQSAVAQFIVDCVESEKWDGKAVQIYQK